MSRLSKQVKASPPIAASDVSDRRGLLLPLNDEELAERNLIEDFLRGELRLRNDQERAKQALLRLLMERARGLKPLPLNVGINLALLFDPRLVKLKIEHRKRKPGFGIAIDIARRNRAGEWEAAVKDVMAIYKVSRATVTRAWAEHREAAEAALEWELELERYLDSEDS